MTRRLASCLVALLALGLLSIPARAEASPLQFGSNFYELILSDAAFPYTSNTWSAASTAAGASVFMGVNGHLATVTSDAENAFLIGLAPATTARFSGAWLGGSAATGGWLVGPESGQAFSYTNWGGIEPNNAGYAYLNIGLGIDLGADGTIDAGDWADDSLSDGTANGTPGPADPVRGYFVEYESPQRVPEPGSMSLLGLGVLGLRAARRRRSA